MENEQSFKNITWRVPLTINKPWEKNPCRVDMWILTTKKLVYFPFPCLYIKVKLWVRYFVHAQIQSHMEAFIFTCTFVLALKKVYMVELFLHKYIDFELSLLSIEYFSDTNITVVIPINLVNEVFHVNGYKNTMLF